MSTGIFVGKFLPPHKGHIKAILDASKKCDKLYVVVGEDPVVCEELCEQAGLPYISLAQKAMWVRLELGEQKNIKIVPFDERGIKPMPYGWEVWSRMKK